LLQAQGTSDGIVICNSDEKREARKDKMNRLKISSDYKVVFGTFSILSTGTDIPSADMLLIAGDLKSSVLARQSVGRILRIFEGKPNPVIIDIYDTGNPIFRRQGKLRQQLYSKLGWEIQYV
jgi:superfamily II DNA or RNA helicase